MEEWGGKGEEEGREGKGRRGGEGRGENACHWPTVRQQSLTFVSPSLLTVTARSILTSINHSVNNCGQEKDYREIEPPPPHPTLPPIPYLPPPLAAVDSPHVKRLPGMISMWRTQHEGGR